MLGGMPRWGLRLQGLEVTLPCVIGVFRRESEVGQPPWDRQGVLWHGLLPCERWRSCAGEVT